LGPRETVGTGASVDELLHFPVGEIDGGDLVFYIAGDVGDLAVWTHQDFLRRAGNGNRVDDLQRGKVDDGYQVASRNGYQQRAAIFRGCGAVAGSR